MLRASVEQRLYQSLICSKRQRKRGFSGAFSALIWTLTKTYPACRILPVGSSLISKLQAYPNGTDRVIRLAHSSHNIRQG